MWCPCAAQDSIKNDQFRGHTLSDEAAANMLAFLNELAHLIESHYADQLHRYHNRPDARQADLWSETDPPF